MFCHVERLGEQQVRACLARNGARGCGQDDEGMGVAALLVRGLLVKQAGEPAAGDGIAERTRQPGQSVFGQRAGPVDAQHVRQRVDVRHPGRDPGVQRPVEVWMAALVQPGRAAAGVREPATEVDQAVELGGQNLGGDRRLCTGHAGRLAVLCDQ